MYCTVLYCTVLYCTVLHYTAMHCTRLYYTALQCNAMQCTALLTALHCTALLIALHCTALHYKLSCTALRALHYTADHLSKLITLLRKCTHKVKHEKKDDYQSKNQYHGKRTEIGYRKVRGKHFPALRVRVSRWLRSMADCRGNLGPNPMDHSSPDPLFSLFNIIGDIIGGQVGSISSRLQSTPVIADTLGTAIWCPY